MVKDNDIIRALDALQISNKYKNTFLELFKSISNKSGGGSDTDEDTDIINNYAYGVRWSDIYNPEVVDENYKCDRIGNMDLHVTLPIQSKLSLCIHQGQKIIYYCDPNDGRFIADENLKTIETYDRIELTDDNRCIVINHDNARFRYAWVKIYTQDEEFIGRVIPIDNLEAEADKNKIYCSDLANSNHIVVENYKSYLENVKIEYGASINGYDGELGVDTGAKWYLWAKEYDNTHEIWMSTMKCVSYAREVPRFIIGNGASVILNESIKDRDDANKWGWLGTLPKYSVVNICNYMNFARGINLNIDSDKQLNHYCDNITYFDFNKASATNHNGVVFDAVSLGKGNYITTYDDFEPISANKQVQTANENYNIVDCRSFITKPIWEALVWMYVVEYANLQYKQDFIEELDKNYHHQGGLGVENFTLASNDATLEFGNNTNRKQTGPYNFDTNMWSSASAYTKRNFTGNVVANSINITATESDNCIIASISPYWLAGTVKVTIQNLNDNVITIHAVGRDNIITEDGTYDIDFGIEADFAEYRTYIKIQNKVSDGNIIISLGEVKPTIMLANYGSHNKLETFTYQYRGINDFANIGNEFKLFGFYGCQTKDDEGYGEMKLDENGKPTYALPKTCMYEKLLFTKDIIDLPKDTDDIKTILKDNYQIIRANGATDYNLSGRTLTVDSNGDIIFTTDYENNKLKGTGCHRTNTFGDQDIYPIALSPIPSGLIISTREYASTYPLSMRTVTLYVDDSKNK